MFSFENVSRVDAEAFGRGDFLVRVVRVGGAFKDTFVVLEMRGGFIIDFVFLSFLEPKGKREDRGDNNNSDYFLT